MTACDSLRIMNSFTSRHSKLGEGCLMSINPVAEEFGFPESVEFILVGDSATNVQLVIKPQTESDNPPAISLARIEAEHLRVWLSVLPPDVLNLSGTLFLERDESGFGALFYWSFPSEHQLPLFLPGTDFPDLIKSLTWHLTVSKFHDD